MIDALTLLKEIADVRKDLARLDAGTFPGTPVYRATPACDRRCARCDIACAMLTGELYDLEQQAAAAFARLPSSGSFHIMEAGNA